MTRHRLDLVSLTAGLLFAAVAVVAMTAGVDWVDDIGRWFLPVALLVIGLAGLAASLRRDGSG